MVKNPGWQEADHLAIYKGGRGVEPGATEKQLQIVVRTELEPGNAGFQVWHPNHSTTLHWHEFHLHVNCELIFQSS